MKDVWMNTDSQGGFTMTAEEKNRRPNPGEWGRQTQLLFNLAMPTCVHNRATSARPPAPVVIEKLAPHSTKQDDGESCGSSLRLSVLSEERLQAAVRLAKRDLYRKRRDSMNSLLRKSTERSTSLDWNSTANLQSGFSPKGQQRKRSPKRQTKSYSEVLVYTPEKLPVTSLPAQGQSPPSRDAGLRGVGGEPQLSREIHKLQKQLTTYIQRIEQLAKKGRPIEAVEEEEKHRLEVRRQEQAARSSRIIYALQQQVKEIQADLEKLRSQSVGHIKKSRAVDRLAAAHRGAVRAMQVFINQLSDPAESRVPAQCQELGQLIRQLFLCSARLDVGQGSAMPETTLDILQKLETLDSALSKKDRARETEPQMRSSSPVRERSPRARALSMCPPRVPHALTGKAPRGPVKPAALKKPFPGRRAAGRPKRGARLSDQERGEVLRVAVQSLVHQRELSEGEGGRESRPEPHSCSPATGAVRPAKSKQGDHVRDASFQQATVSSRLRESQLPQREASVPWIPTSPHSPTKQRAVSSRPEPRCLFSPVKSSSRGRSSTQQETKTAAGRMRQAHHEALRHAWLDGMTEDGLRQLNQLTKEETERIGRLRSEVLSPTQWAQRTEEAARERLQPLLDSVQAAAGVDDLNGAATPEALPGEAGGAARVEADQAHSRLLWEPMLERMLQRMEEMERDEEEVRRRFATISYADYRHWERNAGAQRRSDGSRPTSPQPIRMTKAVVKPFTTAEILIQRPVESGRVSESSPPDEEASAPVCSPPPPGLVDPEGRVRLSVPPSVLKNIQEYREAHDSYLRLVSHEAVGNFDPWAVAERLAEELMTEALADVAAEFQEVCEQYAEAIFTSEFLQPCPSSATGRTSLWGSFLSPLGKNSSFTL
ncbi:protein moonraker isoform X1 [Electrophorus electricus]|uniref:protein moonraker isoform X1 n=1 Tax=Electrophorus electricus TaxID=8005 RepID=UPI0015D04D27|nr:protein moonraker isoform X1 [Electrophorus electricus]